jgi:hypothetical protein
MYAAGHSRSFGGVGFKPTFFAVCRQARISGLEGRRLGVGGLGALRKAAPSG